MIRRALNGQNRSLVLSPPGSSASPDTICYPDPRIAEGPRSTPGGRRPPGKRLTSIRVAPRKLETAAGRWGANQAYALGNLSGQIGLVSLG